MDPKQVLEAFRVDEIKPTPVKKKTKSLKKNTFLLILLATILGLSTGVSSAFAIGLPDVAPMQTPLDQPASKAKVVVQTPSISIPAGTSELSPLKPPLDQPAVEEQGSTPIANESVHEKPVDESNKPVVKHQENKKKSDTDVQISTAIPSNNMSTTQKEQQQPTNENTTQPKQEKGTNPVNENNQSTVHSVKVNPIVESVHQNSAANKAPNEKPIVHHTSIATNPVPQKQIPTIHHTTPKLPSVSVVKNESPDPSTQQGTLPHTADNDLNHAVICFALVCLSIAYLLSRREYHPAQ